MFYMQNSNMVNKNDETNSLNRAIKQSLRKGFIKWLLMGIVAGLIIGGSTALIIHFRTPAVQGPINEQETYTQHMAKQLQELVPAYRSSFVHLLVRL